MGKTNVVATVASVFVTLAGLALIGRTLHHTRRTADYAFNMVDEAKKTTKATVDAARAAVIERDPLIAIESVEVGPGSVVGTGMGFKVDVLLRNAGGSAARGYKLDIQHSLTKTNGFDAFITECQTPRDPSMYF